MSGSPPFNLDCTVLEFSGRSQNPRQVVEHFRHALTINVLLPILLEERSVAPDYFFFFAEAAIIGHVSAVGPK